MELFAKLSLLPLLSLLVSGAASYQPPTQVHLLSLSGESVQPVVQKAVENINCRQDLLPDYTLVVITADDGCNDTDRTVLSYVQNVLYGGRDDPRTETLSDSNSFVGIIGPSCLESVETISSLTNRPRLALPHIHLAASPSLQDRQSLGNSFGIIGSSASLVETVFAVMRKNDWKNISVLYEADQLSLRETFQYMANRISIEANGSLRFVSQIDNGYIPLGAMVQNAARVVIVLARQTLIAKVMCAAYRNKMVYPTFQWIILEHNPGEFVNASVYFEYDDLIYDCPNLDSAFSRSLFVNYNVIINGSLQTDTNVSCNDYFQYNNTINTDASLMYDAVWALAFALDNTLKDNKSLAAFGNTFLTNEITSHLTSRKFQGISGTINFDILTGYNRRMVNVYQITDGMESLIGYYSNQSLSITSDEALFITNSKLVDYVQVKWQVSLVITLVTLILLTVLVILHVFTVVYRKQRSIKAANPKINHLIFVGCYLIVAHEMVYLWPLKTLPMTTPEREGALCLITLAWMLPIAWSLIFAPLTAHVWRLYRIFTHFTNPGRCISDAALSVIITVQVGIDVFIALLWTIADPTYIVTIETGTVNEEGIPIVAAMCTNNSLVWFPSMVLYKLLQLMALLVLCLLTKNIKAREFATSRYKVASYLIGFVFVFLVAIFTILFLTNAEIHADVVVYCILANVVLVLCFAFILYPPVIPILREKTGRTQNDLTKSSVVIL